MHQISLSLHLHAYNESLLKMFKIGNESLSKYKFIMNDSKGKIEEVRLQLLMLIICFKVTDKTIYISIWNH